MKESFRPYFEEYEEINDVFRAATRPDCKIPKSIIDRLYTIQSLNEYPNEFIMNLFAFLEGIQLLLNHKQDLIDRGLFIYILSSPFVPEETLLEILNDEDIIGYCNDSWLEHLYANPNIWDEADTSIEVEC